MARAVRKVSRANTKDQRKERKISKKWLITIISTVVLLVVGLGVGLGLYYGLNKDNTYVSDKIYFNEPTLDSNGNEVTFNKENYQAISRYINSGDGHENIFIFVYDGSAFYADEKDEDNFQSEYVELIKRVADFQYNVNQAKARGVDIEFYIVDVHVDNATNAGILSDPLYGSLYSEDSLSYPPAFIYVKGDQFQEKVEYEEDGKMQSYIVSTKSWTDVYNSSIRFAINYINSL